MHNDICVRFGRRICRIRSQKGWKQIDLSVSTNLSRTHISKIENGRKEAGLRTVEKIANALEISLAHLFKGM